MNNKSLDHLENFAFSPSVLRTFCNKLSIGPVTVEYCVDLVKSEITFEVYLSGVRIGGGRIDDANPTVTIEGSFAGAKVSLTLAADFAGRKVTYDLTVCLPIVGCESYKGVLFSW